MEIYYQIKKDILKSILIFIIIFIIINNIRNFFGIGIDNSDINGMNRSGLKIHTDALTGVQYISNGNSMTVRIDSTGKPIIINQ